MFLHFCSFQPTAKNSAESGGKQNNRHSDRPNMAYPKLVAISSESDLRRMLSPSRCTTNSVTTTQAGQKTSIKETEIACFHISGKPSDRKVFQNKPVTSYSNLGGCQPRSSIIHTSTNGLSSGDNKLIHFNPTSMTY